MIVRAATRYRREQNEEDMTRDLVLRAETVLEAKTLARLARYFRGRLSSRSLDEALVGAAHDEPERE